MATTHISYEIPPGAGRTLLFEAQGATAPLRNMKFIMGGNRQTLQVQRIVGLTSDDPDIQFTNAAPYEVTVFFAQNPLPSVSSSQFIITVDNSGTSDQQLQVGALYD